ncbi:hypothetical protein DFH08DRAFT_813699 [Mycena albidolilacea]|uniref:Uncharacterized protein n=1 Tax=Mycena albidolilacea TaxID=1033008 RepID=A0AAD7EL56_9AGAR|nr:hypothetical protein DFH08DRAFT_813699 [Mycena albidolilacea]
MRLLGTERKLPTCPDRAPPQNVTFNQRGIQEYHRTGEQTLRSRLQNMEVEHREGLERLQTLGEDDDFDPGHLPDAPNMVNMGDILDGSARIEISHAGGEFGSLEEDIEEDSGDDNAEAKARKAEDWRTRQDRTETRNRAFLSQMPEMVSAYMRFYSEPEMSMRLQSAERARQATVEEI